ATGTSRARAPSVAQESTSIPTRSRSVRAPSVAQENASVPTRSRSVRAPSVAQENASVPTRSRSVRAPSVAKENTTVRTRSARATPQAAAIRAASIASSDDDDDDDDDDGVMSPLTTPPSSPRAGPSSAVVKVKIERPPRAGRLNLLSLLKWDAAFFASCKNHAIALSQKHLDTTLSLRNQDPAKISKLRAEMLSAYPIIDDYDNYWPLDVMLMLALKNSSSTHKNKKKGR
ncbi:hypothetical protein H0H92_012599, partial [Tricholoma furcatifolium]